MIDSSLPIGLAWWRHRLPQLEILLESPLAYLPFAGKDLAAVAGWGRKPSSRQARKTAERRKIPCLTLEDGFLRSVGLGKCDPPLSIVIDDLGIYYDADSPSRLESLICQSRTAAEIDRARSLLTVWRQSRVSKYNHAREFSGPLPTRYVLVVDQTRGDAAIRYGRADQASFQRMLAAALTERPTATVLLKVHPEVLAGRKRGHFDLAEVGKNPRVQVLAEDVHPVALIAQAEAIYTVTSQVGFEGLLWGKPVRTFGMPFYAGWGLTGDELPAPERRQPVPLEHLVHAALIDYPRYVDPETGQRCEVETVLAHLALQRRLRARFPATVHAVGFSRWKRPIVHDYFFGSTVRFHRSPHAVPPGAMVAVWGRKPLAGDLPSDCQLVRLEDGFLRSVGLGADLVRPLSWVMDKRGIYYDATEPSDLEELLQHGDFDAELLARAERLRARIVTSGLTKYNVGAGKWQRPASAARVILVPGQVENDASIRYGAPGIATNMELLSAVRQANPGAYVIYKPHPDVLAGLRASGAGEEAARAQCDEIVEHVTMSSLLDAVDEVHVMTSLAGFEALLRGKRVVTYGQPFYAGWGLTSDLIPPLRRTRQLTLAELVAGVLIDYPVYLSRCTGRFTTPERALDELLLWREEGSSRLPLWRRLWRLIVKLGVLGK
jgi:capsular polysaccharide export protein